MLPLPHLPTQVFGSGGQSSVYEHPSQPHLLIKVFTDGQSTRVPRTGPDAAHIESLNEFKNGVTLSQRQLLQSNFSWPIEVYGSRPGVIDGIGILRAPEDFWVDITYHTAKPKRRFLDCGFLTTDFLEAPAIKSASIGPISFEDRVEIALEFLYSLQVLWDLGYRFCDYKEQNFSFTLKDRPRVFIIDAESVSPPNESTIRSPGWFAPAHLGYTMESDRSLACLLVWRIIGKDHGLVPPTAGSKGFLDSLDRRTIDLLHEGYRDGSQAVIDALVNNLRRYRSAENVRKGFEWAVSTQLAALVLRYAPPNPARQEAQIIADARDQKVLEDELLALPPRLRQLRKNRSVPRPGFVFDVPDAVFVGSNDREEELIRQLALDGEFEEVAQAFKDRRSGEPVSQVATRAIQAAIAELGPPPVRTNANSGRDVRIQWSWPGTDVVTGARIRLYLPDGSLSQEGYCDRARQNPSLVIPARSSVPDGSKIVVCYAMHFEDGKSIVCPLGTESVLGAVQQQATRHPFDVTSAPTTPGPVYDYSHSTSVTTPLQGEYHDRRPDPIVGKNSAIVIDMSSTSNNRSNDLGDPPPVRGSLDNTTVPVGRRARVVRIISDLSGRILGGWRKNR